MSGDIDAARDAARHGTTIGIGARAKFSGFVMTAGEVLVAQSSVVDSLDIIASGVEIT